MAFVRLSNMPTPPTPRVSTIQNLSGGLNLHDIPWQLGPNQSPDMKNMWWEDGALRSRPGQTTYNDGMIKMPDDLDPVSYNGEAHTLLYHNWYVFRSGDKLRAVPKGIDWGMYDLLHLKGQDPNSTVEVGEHPGSFFLFDGVLYYKSPGYYYKITVSDWEMYENSGLYRLQAEEVQH